MEDLIEGLEIIKKYLDDKNKNKNSPINCAHDELQIADVGPTDLTEEDRSELERLGFECDDDEDYIYSFRFGSC